MTAVLKAQTAADFLSMVPGIAGYECTDSLVTVMFSGKRTAGAFRFDLPAETSPGTTQRLADAVVAMALRMPGIDGVAPVVYTDETFGSGTAVPRRALLRSIERRAESAGLRLVDALCVAADGYASVFDPHVPAGGHPLDEIATNAMGLEAHLLDETRVKDLAALGTIPEADLALADRVGIALENQLDGIERDAFGAWRRAEPIDPVAIAEACVADEAPDAPGRLPARLLARLVAVTLVPARRDIALMTIAFGTEVGRRVEAEQDDIERIMAETGLDIDAAVQRQLDAGDPTGVATGEALMGLGERPDPARIERGIRVLRHAIAHVAPIDRPGALCVLAWSCWALGLTSVAARHVDAALRIEPDHGMGLNMRAMIAASHLPEWAFRGPTGAAAGSATPRATGDELRGSLPVPGHAQA